MTRQARERKKANYDRSHPHPMTDTPDLEERVAALEAAVALLTREALQSGDITINAVRAARGLPLFREPWADSPGLVQVEDVVKRYGRR